MESSGFLDELASLTAWDDHSPTADESLVTVSAKEISLSDHQPRPRDGLTNDATSVESVSTGDSQPRPSSSATKKRAATRSINVSREKRKHELEALRREASELEDELSRLKRRRDELLQPHLAGDTGTLKTIAPVWDQLAKRQFLARKKAEAQNVRLKQLLATQAQAAEELVGLIQRAQQVEQDAFALPLVEELSVDSSSLEEQFARLSILCAQWFVAFSWHAQVRIGEMRFFDSKIVSDTSGETVVDIYANQSFPFPVSQVETAIWAILQGQCVVEDYAYTQNCDESNDTLVSNFTTATDKDGKRGALKGKYVSRRFRNDQGHFLIATSSSAASEGGGSEGQNHEFLVTEDCWIRILDARELTGVVAATPSSTLTVLQHVRRSRIRCIKPDEQVTDTDIQAVMDLHRILVEEELRWGQLNVESMIVKGAIVQ